MSSVRRVSSVVLLAALCAAVPGMLRGQEKTRFANLQDALQAVPAGIELGEVRKYLAALPHVMAVHDLHVWPMSTTETALTAHLVRDIPDCDCPLLAQAAKDLQDRFRIDHATLQFETLDHECALAPDEMV